MVMTKWILVFALGVSASACLTARAPTAPAERVETASGVRVTLPHWFRVDFPGPVEDAEDVMQTPSGALPCRRFRAKSSTTIAEVRAVESPSGFTVSREAMLAEMVAKAREGKTMTHGDVVHQGRFDGFDMMLVAPPHSPDNPSDFTITCRTRELVSDTKFVMSFFCGDDASADSLVALE
jgi:hypothetical protein